MAVRVTQPMERRTSTAMRIANLMAMGIAIPVRLGGRPGAWRAFGPIGASARSPAFAPRRLLWTGGVDTMGLYQSTVDS
jgi:hypothetical protein